MPKSRQKKQQKPVLESRGRETAPGAQGSSTRKRARKDGPGGTSSEAAQENSKIGARLRLVGGEDAELFKESMELFQNEPSISDFTTDSAKRSSGKVLSPEDFKEARQAVSFMRGKDLVGPVVQPGLRPDTRQSSPGDPDHRAPYGAPYLRPDSIAKLEESLDKISGKRS